MKMRTVLVMVALATIFTLGCVSTTPRTTPSQSTSRQSTTPRNWEAIQKDIAKAEAFVSNDPVSAFLSYKELLGSQFTCSAEQRQELQARMAELEPLATARITDDYQQAVTKGWLRDVALIGIIKAQVTNESPQQVQDTINAYLSQQRVGSEQLIWTVSDVAAENVGSEYRDISRPNPGGHGTSVAVRGSTLVRVSASVSNVSDSGDVQYIRWSLEPIKRLLSDLSVEVVKIGVKETGRWLDNSHIFLSVNGAGAKCIYVCDDSDIPNPGRGMLITKITDAKGEVIFIPAFIPKGKSARLNMLFAAPDNVSSAELRVLGAQPISVPVGPKGK